MNAPDEVPVVNLQNIKIIGGLHTDPKFVSQISEEDLEKMMLAIAEVIRKHTRIQAHVGIEYTKNIGTKIND